jgi:predicted NBD/HSP70 family sugar kinase
MLDGHDAILAVDIGGSNIRTGLVQLRAGKGGKKAGDKPQANAAEKGSGNAADRTGDKSSDVARGKVVELDLWRYADEKVKPSRDEAVQRMVTTLERLVRHAAKHEIKLAPFIGVGCPGLISAEGHIERGGQNLPGNWESNRFNLPARLREAIPKIGGSDTVIVMHNDAVVHGLSDMVQVADVERWGVLTIGTGLGNARFTNKRAKSRK